MLELDDLKPNVSIKVLGIGGAGCQVLDYLEKKNFSDAELVFIDTNNNHDLLSSPHKSILINIPETDETKEKTNQPGRITINPDQRGELEEIIAEAELVILVGGMGGHSGTAITEAIAELTASKNIFTIACVSYPFPFEGRKRVQVAKTSLANLEQHLNSLFVIQSSDSLINQDKISLRDAFNILNQISYDYLTAITSLINRPGMINVDLADIRTVLDQGTHSWLGKGNAEGEERAKTATIKAIKDLQKSNLNLSKAQGVIVNITAGETMSLAEFSETGDTIEETFPDHCTIVVGTVIDPIIETDFQVSIIVVGDLLDKSDSVDLRDTSNNHSKAKFNANQRDSLGEPTTQQRALHAPTEYLGNL